MEQLISEDETARRLGLSVSELRKKHTALGLHDLHERRGGEILYRKNEVDDVAARINLKKARFSWEREKSNPPVSLSKRPSDSEETDGEYLISLAEGEEQDPSDIKITLTDDAGESLSELITLFDEDLEENSESTGIFDFVDLNQEQFIDEKEQPSSLSEDASYWESLKLSPAEQHKEDLAYSYIMGEPEPSPLPQYEVEEVRELAKEQEESRFAAMSDRLLLQMWKKRAVFEATGLGNVAELLNLLASVTDAEGAKERKEIIEEFAGRYDTIVKSLQTKDPSALHRVATQLELGLPKLSLSKRVGGAFAKKLRMPWPWQDEAATQLQSLIERSGGANQKFLKGYVAIRLCEQLEEYRKIRG